MLIVFALRIADLAYSSPSIPFAPKMDGKATLKLIIQVEVLRQIKLVLGRVQWRTTVTTATSLQVV
jgi:hypothetical protein